MRIEQTDKKQVLIVNEHSATNEHGTTDVQAPPKKQPAKPKRKYLPPFKLMLHNDDVNTMDDIVRAIVNLTTLKIEEAVMAMLEAHKTGAALLLTTYKERGELYVQQFASMKITTTLENYE